MSGEKPTSVARDFQVSAKTVFKWIARFRITAFCADTEGDEHVGGDGLSGDPISQGG
jgi:hypothetical protein